MNTIRDARLTFWSSLALVTLVDVTTKYLAHTRMALHQVEREIFGGALRLTLVYNPGAAFGFHLGPWSRGIFLALTVFALVVLGRLYQATARRDWPRALALGLVAGGGAGNLINRLWSARGVVDFIDVGIAGHRWPTFNIADIGVSIGALSLAWVLWSEDRGRGNPRLEDPRAMSTTSPAAERLGAHE